MPGLGCMRLSTAADRDDARAIAVVHAALDAGVTLLDTADSYCHDDTETGHNERLIARALREWNGDRSRIEVATKGGLRRPGGAWVSDGRARHLRAACDASRIALGVDAIDLYQLHAVDPRTPIETSVRALVALQKEGTIRRIGLCNVTVGQVEAARAIADIAAVQVSLSVLDQESLRNGVAEYARDHRIRLIAHRPLGGERRRVLARHPVLAEVAVEQGTTAETIALAWLMSFEGPIVPVPGATRVSTAQALHQVTNVRLSEQQQERLDRAFAGRLLRVPRSQRRPPDDARGDVVLVMGMPGAGKTTVAREFTSAGYERLNRDERGGVLADLVPELDRNLAGGRREWVLDNTYPTRASRNEVIECAWNHAVPVRCVHVTTTLPDAQCNAIVRMIEAHGRLPMPEELRDLAKRDPRYLSPDAQFRYERSVEAPVVDEGFTAIEERPFVRQAPAAAAVRAIFLDYDDLVLRGANGSPVRAPDEVRLADGRRETLSRYHEDGWRLFAHAWRPAGPRARQSDDGEAVQRCFARTGELLGFGITCACCVHDAGPPVCWCRKPLPGLLIEFAMRHHIALGSSLAVGSSADRTMANRLGMRFEDARAFFADA